MAKKKVQKVTYGKIEMIVGSVLLVFGIILSGLFFANEAGLLHP